MIVLDANVLIGFLDDLDPHHEAAMVLLERYLSEGLASSVLTVAEALVYPTKAGLQDAALASLDRIGLRIIPMHESDALTLARLRAQYRVRTPDAVAMHAAMKSSAALATFDKALADAAREAGIPVVGN